MTNIYTQIKSKQRLAAGIIPFLPNQPERIRHVVYDTGTYTSGTTTSLTFFQSRQTDPVLGNLPQAGAFPQPQHFELHHLGIYFDLVPSDAVVAATFANAGAMEDLVNLIEGRVELMIADKVYHVSKISMCPPGVGVWGGQSLAGTYTATDGDVSQWGNNGFPDLRNRNNFWGEIIIPPQENFQVQLDWTSAITLDAGNTAIVVFMDGFLYRRVV